MRRKKIGPTFHDRAVLSVKFFGVEMQQIFEERKIQITI
jgi:hypothetical protein